MRMRRSESSSEVPFLESPAERRSAEVFLPPSVPRSVELTVRLLGLLLATAHSVVAALAGLDGSEWRK